MNPFPIEINKSSIPPINGTSAKNDWITDIPVAVIPETNFEATDCNMSIACPAISTAGSLISFINSSIEIATALAISFMACFVAGLVDIAFNIPANIKTFLFNSGLNLSIGVSRIDSSPVNVMI